MSIVFHSLWKSLDCFKVQSLFWGSGQFLNYCSSKIKKITSNIYSTEYTSPSKEKKGVHSEKHWTKARPKPYRAHSKFKCQKNWCQRTLWISHSNSIDCNTPLSGHFHPLSAFLLDRSPKVLASSMWGLQCRQWCAQVSRGDSSITCLASAVFLNHRGLVHNPFSPVSLTLKPEPQGWISQVLLPWDEICHTPWVTFDKIWLVDGFLCWMRFALYKLKV